MQNASHSFSVLSASGAPAVLISACGAVDLFNIYALGARG
jgi:hypothetical protein